MFELTKEEFPMIQPMCKERNITVLNASAEGNLGRIWVDRKGDPKCAIIIAADFVYLLGSIEEPEHISILRGVLEHCKDKIIVTVEISWISFLTSNYPDTFRRFSRYAFKKESNVFLREHLEEYTQLVEPDFQILKIDESIYHMALEDPFMADCCSSFSSLDDFMKHGIGFVIIHNNRIIVGASSYTYHEGSIEVTIGTDSEYRRKGLALACASKLILACLDRNIFPNWDAANLESVKLAQKLGYQLDKEYEAYSI